MSSTYFVPVLEHKGLDGCLLVGLGRHTTSQELHERLHNPVVFVAHLQHSIIDLPLGMGRAVCLHAVLPSESRRGLCLDERLLRVPLEKSCVDFAADGFCISALRNGLQNCLEGVYLVRLPIRVPCEQYRNRLLSSEDKAKVFTRIGSSAALAKLYQP